MPRNKLCLVSGSFDATAGLWRWDGDVTGGSAEIVLETDISAHGCTTGDEDNGHANDIGDREWEFTLVLEGHDSEVKSCAFSPSGAFLATCSRDKSVWIWEDIGSSEAEDEWETIAVLNEHEGDVKAVAWCPDVPGRNSRRQYSSDVLASASYDNTARIWREDSDGEWVCVAVLDGHAGTVWGIEWEPRPNQDRFPRLLTYSADGSIRLWELKDAPDDEDGISPETGLGALGGVPNTMRRSLREEWRCTALLPAAHDRDIYSVAWSKATGLIASTGRDGKVALYRERCSPVASPGPPISATNTQLRNETSADKADGAATIPPLRVHWDLLAVFPNAHGPFEVNHITWSRRFDAESGARGLEEMLITTGDDGVVRSWQVEVNDLGEQDKE